MRRFVPLLLLAVAATALWVWWANRQGLLSGVTTPPDRSLAPVEPPRLEGTAGPSPGEAEGESERSSVGDPDHVSLRILDARTGLPVAGVVVEVHHLPEEARRPFRSSPSGADGRLTLPRYEDQHAHRIIRRSGYVFTEQDVWGGSELTEIRLEPAPALAGRVVDARTGQGLGGARVHATWARTPEEADREQETDAEGRFEIVAVPPDRLVDLIVALDGYATVRCRSDGRPTLEIPLGAGATIAGRVVDGTGRPVPDARVYVADRGAHSPLYEYRFGAPVDEMWPSRTLTDAAGRFSLRGVGAPSAVRVYATDLAGSLGRSDVLRVATAEARVEVEVTIQELGQVEVSFREAGTGREVRPNAVCSLAAEDALPGDWMNLRVDPDSGVAHFTEKRAGSYVLRVETRDDHLAPPARPIEVLSGETLRVRLDLERGRTVTGRLVDGAGNPLVAHLTFKGIWRGARQRSTTVSNLDGRFSLVGVPPSGGTLIASHHRFVDHSWPVAELQDDLGDLVLPVRPVLVGRLPADLQGTPVFYGSVLGYSFGQVRVDEEGRFEIRDLVLDRQVTYFLRPEGRAALVLHDVVVASGAVHDLGLVSFPDPVEITGSLLDAQGEPVPGALVGTVEPWCRERTRTDLAGRFRLSLLPPGRSTLLLQTAPGTVAYYAIDAASGMGPLEIRLPAPGRLLCRVVREDGRGLASARVDILPQLTGDDTASWLRFTRARTDSRGQLDLALYPGRYAVHPWEYSGFEAIDPPTPFEIASGEVVETEIRVRRSP